MSVKKNPSKIDIDMEKALSDALSSDLEQDLDLDMEFSLDDFESQVDDAAKELKKVEAQPAQKPVEKVISAPIPKAAAAFRPANDDNAEREYAQMLARLNSKPSGSPFWVATFVSAVWTGGAAFLAHTLYAPGIWQIRSFDALLAIPGALAILVSIIVPIFMFFGFAAMIRRAQEMRMTATSMSEIAFRLVAPENMATDRVATVGQAIRREVAAMGEGIERTVARAAELEAMMQAEVNELERAYSDNEVRVRSLISDLGNEREGIVTHAERLRASISGAHEELRGELMSAADIIRQNVLNASTQLTVALNQSGDHNRQADERQRRGHRQIHFGAHSRSLRKVDGFWRDICQYA
ncbi:MAG: hypothetical protein U5K75_05435 [Ahrensia sp.]|nr:hypothetical protein [Ahrensia sp.]